MTYEIHEAEFDRLCDLIKEAGPTRRPLITQATGNTPSRRPLRSKREDK